MDLSVWCNDLFQQANRYIKVDDVLDSTVIMKYVYHLVKSNREGKQKLSLKSWLSPMILLSIIKKVEERKL